MAKTSYSASNRKAEPTYAEIARGITPDTLKPVYMLMGEEPFFIDRLADHIVQTALRPEEHDFCLLTYYGAETDIDTVLTAARAFPFGGNRQVVMVKDAARLSGWEKLEAYFKKPQPATVLVFCYTGAKFDRRLKAASIIEHNGLMFESKKLNDKQLPAFIRDYVKNERQTAIDPAAIQMLADHVGADLNRLVGEIDKLFVALADKGSPTITTDLVAAQVGISKDYNVFELCDALGKKDVLKAMRIAKYFDKNPKEGALQKILPMLFRYFSNVMVAYYSPDKSEKGLADWLSLSPWQVRNNVLPPMQHYSGVKVMHIISFIRRTDARSKGIDNPSTPPGELLRELLYYILH